MHDSKYLMIVLSSLVLNNKSYIKNQSTVQDI